MIHTDIAIVGAGPAGSICAILLQQAGRDCVLVDRAAFPREKLCGGGLQPHAWHLLEELLPDFRYDYLTVEKMRLLYEGKFIGEYKMKEPLRIVQRKDFDALLVNEYVRLGGEMLQATLCKVEERSDGLLLTMRDGEQIHCNHLVGADGANSRVRRFLEPDYRGGVLCLEQFEPNTKTREGSCGCNAVTIELSERFDYGYYYEFPNKESIAVGYGHKHTTLEEFRKILGRHGYEEKQIKGAIIPTRQTPSKHPRVTLVGDAGAYADDLTYEGLYYALATGSNAAKALITGEDFDKINAAVARKKRHKQIEAAFIYSRFGLRAVRALGHCTKFCEAILSRYIS